jgi:hypothetical protein
MYCENKNRNTLCVKTLSPNRVKLRRRGSWINIELEINILAVATGAPAVCYSYWFYPFLKTNAAV